MSGESCADSVADTNCGVKMDESLARAHDLVSAVQQLSRHTEDADRRLAREMRLHAQTKEKAKTVEEEHSKVRAAIEKERSDHQVSRARLAEIERFHKKSEAAMKAMSDDLMQVRLQNEALQAEMEVQKKAFVVGVSWETMFAELKSTHDSLVQEKEQLHGQHVQTQTALQTAVAAQEECKQARAQVLEALDRAREDLQRGEELMKAAALTDEVAAEVGGIENLKAHLQNGAAIRKKQREKARLAMEKSLAANDAATEGTIFSAWKTFTKSSRLKKNKKEQNMAVAMRGIAQSGLAIQDFCLTAWHKEVQEAKGERLRQASRELEERVGSAGANAEKARRKALAQLEKQFGSSERGLLREVYNAWMGLRRDRMKMEKAKALAGRSIASNDQALCKQCFAGWSQLLMELNMKRAKKATGNARAMRMIADGENAILDFCLTQWAILTKQARASMRAKEEGHTKAARMMANQGNGLLAQCMTAWTALKKKMQDRDKKMKAVERTLVSAGNGLLQYILQTLHQFVVKSRSRQDKKASSMRKGVKLVHQIEQACLTATMVHWAHAARMCRLERLEGELRAKRNAPVVQHEETLRNQADIAQLEGKLKTMRESHEAMRARADVLAGKNEEVEALLRQREQQLAKVQSELTESRRKARDINEELARVGAFLLNKPRKQLSRPTSGSKGDSNGPLLPRIDQKMPNTAREHRNLDRPESGGARSSLKAETASVASQGLSQAAAARQAWSEAST